jgi:hypothetical protein
MSGGTEGQREAASGQRVYGSRGRVFAAAAAAAAGASPPPQGGGSKLSRQGGFELELRCVLKSLVVFQLVVTLHCLLFAICLEDRQQERATYCTNTVW